MHITTEVRGNCATLTPRGDIDFEHLDQLRTSLDQLPSTVTDVAWDLRDTFFVDIAGLHLLGTPGTPERATSLTNLHPQHRRLLTVACEIFPEAGFDRYLQGPGAQRAA
ncbi:STAS domain-containing protein [Streptomyces zhihengii]|uniref:STAS domain-containing protein n=1 Tax=Streptomyces zhihengii TaxID=1818004 RepID=A0ABS2V1U4_9ACTN|nr:STAS domain-containing protein [Streptomyces zhihengii]MBM9623801.1 STAS domain-containing protein [Streptomyces zhihengii]